MKTKLAEVCSGNAVTGFFQPKKLGIYKGVCCCTKLAKSRTVYQESLFVQHGLEQPGCTWIDCLLRQRITVSVVVDLMATAVAVAVEGHTPVEASVAT